jgi:hypothetical protein
MGERRTRVLFLLQRPEAWSNFESVWMAMHRDPAFDPTVFVLPYNVRDAIATAKQAPSMRQQLVDKGVPFREWHDGDTLEAGQFDAVVINHPYDRERPRELWFERLSATIPVTVYIPYGLPMGGGHKNLRFQYAQPTQVGATIIVARSEIEKQSYSRYCPTGGARVQVLGHPRFDHLQHELATPVPEPLLRAIGGRLTVLWNSHFSFGLEYSFSGNFSTFDLIGPELFELAIRNREWLCLLWRPHPLLMPELMRSGILASEELPALRRELVELGIVLDEQSSHIPAFKASHCLVTDVGSFMLEYLAMDKPILALINHEGEPLNSEAQALVQHYPTATSPEQVEAFINDVRNRDIDFKSLHSAKTRHLPLLDGHAGERVADLILKLDRARRELPAFNNPTMDAMPSTPADRTRVAWETWPPRDSITPVSHSHPAMDRLIRGLRELRASKQAVAPWRRQWQRTVSALELGMHEYVKQRPALMAAVEKLRAKLSRGKP